VQRRDWFAFFCKNTVQRYTFFKNSIVTVYSNFTDAQWDETSPPAISATLPAEMSRSLKSGQTMILCHATENGAAINQEYTAVFNFFWLVAVHP
jgi:hypothetical protein